MMSYAVQTASVIVFTSDSVLGSAEMDAIQLILDDHRNVEDLFDEFLDAEPNDREDIVREIIKTLSIHAAMEETVFYPVVRENVEASDPLVKHSLDEHKEIKQALAKVDNIADKAHTKQCEAKVLRLQKVVDHHVEEEETKILPAVRDALPKTTLDKLGTKMRKAKKTAPTHPHPLAPDEGIAAELTGKVVAPLDRARDALKYR